MTDYRSPGGYAAGAVWRQPQGVRAHTARLLRRAANRIDPPKPVRASLDWDAMEQIVASYNYARARYGRPNA